VSVPWHGLWVLDERGEPIPASDHIAWASWMERARTDDLRRIALTEVGPLTVSTVFLASDHSHGFTGGRPILFETMIFGADDAEYQERFETRAEAEAGHSEAVKIAELYERSRAGHPS